MKKDTKTIDKVAKRHYNVSIINKERRKKDMVEKIIALAISITTIINAYYTIKVRALEIKKLRLEIKKLKRE